MFWFDSAAELGHSSLGSPLLTAYAARGVIRVNVDRLVR